MATEPEGPGSFDSLLYHLNECDDRMPMIVVGRCCSVPFIFEQVNYKL